MNPKELSSIIFQLSSHSKDREVGIKKPSIDMEGLFDCLCPKKLLLVYLLASSFTRTVSFNSYSTVKAFFTSPFEEYKLKVTFSMSSAGIRILL